MFSAVLRKLDAFRRNFDGHSRHSGFLKNSSAAKLRKVLEKRENTRKFSGCGSGGGFRAQIRCRRDANCLKQPSRKSLNHKTSHKSTYFIEMFFNFNFELFGRNPFLPEQTHREPSSCRSITLHLKVQSNFWVNNATGST